MYEVFFPKSFKRDLKKIRKQGLNVNELYKVIDKLRLGQVLEPKYKDHALTGKYITFRECHIRPDWILIYKIEDDKLCLVLSRTGSHSDLF